RLMGDLGDAERDAGGAGNRVPGVAAAGDRLAVAVEGEHGEIVPVQRAHRDRAELCRADLVPLAGLDMAGGGNATLEDRAVAILHQQRDRITGCDRGDGAGEATAAETLPFVRRMLALRIGAQ